MFEKCIYFTSNALARSLSRLWEEAYKDSGLSAAQAYMLRMICHNPDLNQQQIARELFLDKSTVTRILNRLINQGLVSRESGMDSREYRLLPTAAGLELGQTLDQIGAELYRKMQRKIGKEEFSQVVASMRGSLKKL